MAERAHLALDLFVLFAVVFLEEAATVFDALLFGHARQSCRNERKLE
ncbi:MAG: hypothetical protein KBD94_11610 [Pyrinomonadaceae bacterium]|nr:hypothetical protein [Pyrinomonadaceae bacterium]